MTMRRKVWMSFAGIIVLSALAGVIDYPKGPNIRIGKYFKEIKVHLGLDLQGGALLVYEADVSGLPLGDKQAALDGARDVIERRVNAFGVSEPVVQTSKVGEKDRVNVELPGVTNINDAITRIGKTPLLEFREEKPAPPPEPLTDTEKKQISDTNAKAKSDADATLKEVQNGGDFAKLADEKSQDPGNTGSDGVKKGGNLDFADPNNYVPEFRDALLKLKDGEISKDVIESPFGYHIIKREESRPGKNTNGETITEIRARHILFTKLSESDLRPQQQPEFVNTGLTGQHLKRAQVNFDPTTGTPQVSLQFNGDGTKLFAEITKRNLNKSVAIYLDGQPISIPTVQSEITTGEAVITGSFTLQEAKQLATNLNAGALPVPIKLVSQQSIGASLGQSSVERSLGAGLLGLALVSLFMILYYRLPGLLAVCALFFYALIVLAIFKLWPITLTLPGIAGFILSIGMAVDANVLVFERTKEELRLGKPAVPAIEEGFRRAWLSIRDSNMSSLITCFILAWFGTSIIKGFAITLAIGILVSMFTAITVTRTFLRLIARDWFSNHLWLFGIRSSQEQKL